VSVRPSVRPSVPSIDINSSNSLLLSAVQARDIDRQLQARRRSAANAGKKVKGSQYSITERRVPELIPVPGSQRAGDVSHKPRGRLPLLPARPAVTPATLKRAATNFGGWRTQEQWVQTICLRLLPYSVATVI